jgi:CheY-like chemotaxis protein
LQKTEIITDKLRLQQILSNLVGNAIKFTEEGYIEVGCKKLPDDEMLEFYVKDTGIGIKEEHLHIIFERFRKIEDDKNQLHRGTGLGLAISYQLVNLLGGEMHLDSKIGEGSVFYFTIPLLRSKVIHGPIQANKPTENLPNLLNCHILVAEDDVSNYNYIEKLLKKAKAKVIHAVNGKQVLSILQTPNKINLILMDIKMPEMDGIEALHELRKMNIRIPVIAQTAYALANEVVKLKNEGFDDYISKPIDPVKFYLTISQCLRNT